MAVVSRAAPGDHQAHDDATLTTTLLPLASLGFLVCLVLSLVGIKIWWFKHRLHFDQSSTSNGAVGGSQPRVAPPRTRSSKDKRLSQQFREPVDVHGVFRKRQEDELDLDPPRPLPPVRPRKHSRSSPALFQPPTPSNERKEPGSEALHTIPDPPTHDPPVPPMRRSRSVAPREEQQRIPPPTIQIEREESVELRAVEENPQEDRQVDHEVDHQVNLHEDPRMDLQINIQGNPQMDHQRNIQGMDLQRNSHMDLQGNSHMDFQLNPQMDPQVNPHKDLQVSPQGDQVDYQVKITPPTPQEIDSSGPKFLKMKTSSSEKVKPSVNLTERRATGFLRPSDDEWQHLQEEVRQEKAELQELEDFQDERVEEAEPFESPGVNAKSVQFNVEEDDEEESEDPGRRSKMLNQRRPTGYVHDVSQLLTDLDADNDSEEGEASDRMWREMESELRTDFGGNVDEEFDRIRHSYEANEERILEDHEVGTRRPTGFGKSIDEDWENFEKLDENAIKERRPTGYTRQTVADNEEADDEGSGEDPARTKVKFNVEDYDEEEDKGTSFIKQRRPTGFVREGDEIHAQMRAGDDFAETQPRVNFQLDRDTDDDEDDDEVAGSSSLIKQRRPTGFVRDGVDPLNPQWAEDDDDSDDDRRQTKRVNFELADDDEGGVEQTQPSILKQRRPTGFFRRDEMQDFEADEDEDEKEEGEEDLIRKAKPRPKVTFRFSTEPRSPTPEAEEEEDDDVDDYREMPKPMARLTKTRTENTAALLFSTQVSAEYAAAAAVGTTTMEFNDSWSAIRQHRHLTEELQQLTLDTEAAAVEPAPRSTPPQPAYRNPLAQLAASSQVPEVVEDAEEFAKPRTMRDMRKQMRHEGHTEA